MSVFWLAAVVGWVAVYEAGWRRMGRAGARPAARRWCWYAAGLLLAAVGEPPLSALAQRSLWAETLQFGLLAFAVAPLAVLGWPRPASRRPASRRVPRPAGPARAVTGIAALGCFLAVTIGWRVPPAVDAVASGGGWLALEAATVLGGSWWLWAELTGRAGPALAQQGPRRIALAAPATWSVWVFAYVLGFSAHPFYPAFGSGGAPVAAQEVAVGVLLATSALAFCPVMFVNLTRWLGADQAAAEAEMDRYRARPPAVGETVGETRS